MINKMLKDITRIYIAYGVTDFRKQTHSLCNIVRNEFNLNLYNNSAFIFCNKKRNSIRVLCYDKNGFVLTQKTLLETEKMKFDWPRNKTEMELITKEQLNWLLSGLKMYPKKYFKDIKLDEKNIAI